MRIAIFTDSFLPTINGVVTSVVNASMGLSQRGHKILIITSYKNKREKIDLGDGIDVHFYRPVNPTRYPDFELTVPDVRIIEEIRKFRPHVIHSHMPTPLGWEAVMCSKVFRVPLVGTYHTFLPDFAEHIPVPSTISTSKYAESLIWKYTRRYYNRCSIITTPSEAMAEKIKVHRLKKPVKVISNGVSFEHFHPGDMKKNGDTILHVGRVSYEKNIDVIIKAFKRFAGSHDRERLVIVGDGPDMDRLKMESGEYLDRKIFFRGRVDQETLRREYLEADLFATASTIETEGLVILEAMACGLPVIGVRALAIPGIVKHEVNGFIAEPYDAERIAEYMDRLITDGDLRERMGGESLKIVERYSLDHTISELEELYGSLIG